MSEAFICDAVRTPIGRYGRALASARADDLAAVPLAHLPKRNSDVDWAKVEDVIYGCANQAGEDNRNVARTAVLLSGMPVSIPGTTVKRLCGSGMDAVGMAARASSPLPPISFTARADAMRYVPCASASARASPSFSSASDRAKAEG